MKKDEQQKALEGLSWYRFLKVLSVSFLIFVFLVPTIQAGNAGRGAIFGAVDGLVNVSIWGFIIYLAKGVLLYVKFGKQSNRNNLIVESKPAPASADILSTEEYSSHKEVQITRNKITPIQLVLLLIVLVVAGVYLYNHLSDTKQCMRAVSYVPAMERPGLGGSTKEDSHYEYGYRGGLGGYGANKFQTMNEAIDYCMASKKD